MKKAIIKIEGMHCTSCSGNVEKALSKISGVKNIKVNLLFNKATMEIEDKVTKDQLEKAVKDTGYTPINIDFS
jgi:copper chaperone CopZ